MALPSGYKRLAYLESTGTQYIDTEVKSSSNIETRIEGNIQTQSGMLFGSRQSSNSGLYEIYLDNGTVRVDFGYNSENTSGSTPISNLSFKDGEQKINGNIVSSFSESFSTNYNIYLFALNDSGTLAFPSSYELSSCKIYNGSVLVRNFIPVKRNSDNTIGLFDLVNFKFYQNNGTGSFISGPETGEIILDDNPIIVEAYDDTLSFQANFRLDDNIRVQANPTSYGSVFGNGLYAPGDEVTLTAVPRPGYRLSSWTKDGTTVSTNKVYQFTKQDASLETYVANFYQAEAGNCILMRH